jgi:hypothetical protein
MQWLKVGRVAAGLIVGLSLVAPFAAARQDGERPAGKPQAELAAKDKAFAKISPDSPEVKKATPASDLGAAKAAVGKPGAFVGVVERVFSPASNSVVLLNFAQDYRKAVVGQVRAADFGKFPDLKKLEKKRVLISGKVTEYKDRPQVELTTPASIKIIE